MSQSSLEALITDENLELLVNNIDLVKEKRDKLTKAYDQDNADDWTTKYEQQDLIDANNDLRQTIIAIIEPVIKQIVDDAVNFNNRTERS